MSIHRGLSLKARVPLAVWALGVIVTILLTYEALQLSETELVVFATVVIFGSFYAVFLPLWRRLPEDWRRS
ncbi:hypothetical protein DVK05_10265 [Halorubrum sp. Atlit-8R]|nr:hypothetical protein DVK08_10330 [Halorubrum sp. Atlit-9R]RLM81363.1 hypothetical protein DVK05_10265 [Halorubrum sp. Atlit-8R]